MIKNYLTLCLGSLILSVNAQNASLRNATSVENEPVITREVQNAVSTSTVVRLSAPGFAPASTCSANVSRGLTPQGYVVSGTSTYLDKEFSQRFDLTTYSLTTPASISSVDMVFSYAGSGTGSVTAKIYSDNLGTPSTLLGTSLPIAVTSCSTPLAPNTYTFTSAVKTTFTFSTAVNLTSTKFHVSLELPNAYTYTSYTSFSADLGLLYNAKCAADDSSIYARASDNKWINVATAYSSTFNKKGSLAIEPMVSANNISTSLKNQSKNSDAFTVFPNPVNNDLTVSYNLNNSSKTEIRIYDVTGKLVLLNKTEELPVGYNTAKIDVSNLNSGVYMVELKTKESSSMKKFIIAK
jgi:hypothetical protein